MKDKIYDILTDHIYISDLEDRTGPTNAADELTALMCYREVRAYCRGKNIQFNIGLDSFTERFIIHQFKDDYAVEIITKAIEQVKKETT